MSTRGIIALIGLVVGAVAGIFVGYIVTEHSTGGAVVGGVIGAAFGGSLPFVPVEAWEALSSLGDLLDCCSALGVLFITGAVTIGGLVLWRSVFMAALSGGSALLLLFFGLLIANLIASQTAARPQ